jgi:hypothetical protein
MYDCVYNNVLQLGLEMSRAKLGSVWLAKSTSCKRRLDLVRYQLASRTLKTNIALYSELIVCKCKINNHNTTLQVI